MEREKVSSVTRRSFIKSGSAALASAAVSLSDASMGQGSKKIRVAVVGTGNRGSHTWGSRVIEDYSDFVEIVGLCDINGKRARIAKEIMRTEAPTFVDFDEMVKKTKPDTVVITTVDSTHYRYILRALELGCDAVSEKPMCTDEEQVQAVMDAEKRSDRKLTVAFNARHGRGAKKVKELLMDRVIGDVLSVDFHEYLNTSHGADYFRRWHRLKENSGTLLVHKASHHFDQANWWLDSDPLEVSAIGDLKFYGRNGAFRSTHCRVCPYKSKCKFHWNIMENERYIKLYVNAESEDGYLRDGCVFRMNTNIYDTMAVLVQYENGAQLTYTANTYLPFEGQSISFNGTKGRLDYSGFGGAGHRFSELRLTPSFGESKQITDLGPARKGGHGGSDMGVKDLVFRPGEISDPLGLKADARAGAMSSLIGIAAYRSIEREGQKIRVSDLVNLS
jgi:predicted dehydrogenase